MSEALAPKTSPTLFKVGKRAVSLRGYRSDLMQEHLENHLLEAPSKRFCPISCAARTMYGRDTPSHRDSIRRQLPRLFRRFLQQGRVLSIEYAPHGGAHHGEAQAMKIWQKQDDGASGETQFVALQIKRKQRRLKLTQDDLSRVYEILQLSLPLEANES